MRKVFHGRSVSLSSDPRIPALTLVTKQGYQRAKLVSAEEVDLLKTLERQVSFTVVTLTELSLTRSTSSPIAG